MAGSVLLTADVLRLAEGFVEVTNSAAWHARRERALVGSPQRGDQARIVGRHDVRGA
jgi:hypothetical protein